MGERSLIVADTHVLVWMDAGSASLGAKARRALDKASEEGRLHVSAISFWEVGTLVRKGRLSIAMDVGRWRESVLGAGVIEVPMTGEIGLRAATLGGFHADPADRIIVSTALGLPATLFTADERILDWAGDVKCRDARE